MNRCGDFVRYLLRYMSLLLALSDAFEISAQRSLSDQQRTTCAVGLDRFRSD